MADINLNFGTTDLKDLKKTLEDILRTYEKIKNVQQTTGTITADEELLRKKLLAESLKLTNEINKQQRIQEKNNKDKKVELGSVTDLTNRYRAMKKELDGIAKKTPEQIEGLRRVKRALDDARGSTNNWGKALDSFQFKFNALGNIAANVLRGVRMHMTEFVKDSVRMAAATEGVRNAFVQLNKRDLLNNLRSATRGAVNDLSLMKAAVLAENFRIPLDQLAVFLKYAGNQALRTGQDFDYLVESIIIGLGRESVLKLDNLGLSTKALNDEIKKTGSFFEGAAIVIQQEMTKAGDVVDTTATQLARLNATLDNLKIELGQNIAPAVGSFAGWLSDGVETLNKLGVSIFDFLAGPGVVYAKYQKGVNQYLDDQLKKENDIISLKEKSISSIQKYGKETPKTGVDKKSIEQIRPFDPDANFTELYENMIDELLILTEDWTKEEGGLIDEAYRNFVKSWQDRTFIADQEAKKQSQIIQSQKIAELSAYADFFAGVQALAGQNTVIFKLAAIAEATISMWLAAAKVMAEEKGGVKKKLAAYALILATGFKTLASLKAVKVKQYGEGGEIHGKPHSQGGTMIEAERGEFVVRKSAYQKNKELIKAINMDDSRMIAEALRSDKKIEVKGKDYTKELYEWMKKQPVYGEDNEFFIIHSGNKTIKIHKN